jgi:hypothetical protein
MILKTFAGFVALLVPTSSRILSIGQESVFLMVRLCIKTANKWSANGRTLRSQTGSGETF